MHDIFEIIDNKLSFPALHGSDDYYHNTYSSLPHIDDISKDENFENDIVLQIMRSIQHLEASNDFSLSRLHRHFELSLGERLVEKMPESSNELIIAPEILSEGKHYIPTSFKFLETNSNSISFTPLEYKVASISYASHMENWYNSQRIETINTIGSLLKNLNLEHQFGFSIADYPSGDCVWVETTCLIDRSHRLSLLEL